MKRLGKNPVYLSWLHICFLSSRYLRWDVFVTCMWKGMVLGKVVSSPAQHSWGNAGGTYPARDAVLHTSHPDDATLGKADRHPAWLAAAPALPTQREAWGAVPRFPALPHTSLQAKGSFPSPFLTLRGACSQKSFQWLLQINWQRRGNVWAPPAMCELLTSSEGAQLATLVACGEASMFSCWADVPSCQLCLK